MAQVIDSDVNAFRASFTGTVMAPGHAGYDEARSIWNGNIDRRPGLIARCSSAAEVAAAIRFARAQDLEISVRGGGHGMAGLAVTEGGLMIDLSPMKEVRVDPVTRRAVAGGGAYLGNLDAATQAHGLAVPSGVVSHTGVAGLTLGGGAGWLTRKAGLTIDNLVSAEVVTADGTVLTASTRENPELFWAIRGGGGNFGVVTSFEFQLHQVGPLVNLGLFFWGLEQGAEALRYIREFVKELPDDMGVMVAGLNAPPTPFVPERHHFTPGYALIVVGYGSPEHHHRAVQPLREAHPPLFEVVTPIPYTQLQQLLDEGNPWGIQAYEKGLHVDELTDEVIDVFIEHLPKKRSPLSVVAAYWLSGAYERVGDQETAFSGNRARCYMLAVIGLAPTPELLGAEWVWVRSVWAALQPHARSSRAYVNLLGEVGEDAVRATYGAAKHDRLARIKAIYDPDNVFHLNANIKPARAT